MHASTQARKLARGQYLGGTVLGRLANSEKPEVCPLFWMRDMYLFSGTRRVPFFGVTLRVGKTGSGVTLLLVLEIEPIHRVFLDRDPLFGYIF